MVFSYSLCLVCSLRMVNFILLKECRKLPEISTESQSSNSLPSAMPISIFMESRPSNSQWADEYWKAVGVTVGQHADAGIDRVRLVFEEQGLKRYLYSGFQLKLYVDQCESYYHNLVSPYPKCYVITEINEEGVPVPILVSMSFDEAHAYLEGDDQIYAVEIPPEVYVWTEAYVIANYFPEKKIKRKFNDWKAEAQTASGVKPS